MITNSGKRGVRAALDLKIVLCMAQGPPSHPGFHVTTAC